MGLRARIKPVGFNFEADYPRKVSLLIFVVFYKKRQMIVDKVLLLLALQKELSIVYKQPFLRS